MDCALLISSCEMYSDLWDAHVNLLRKNWADNPYNTFLITDVQTEKSYDGITIFSEGKDFNFPMRIKRALERIDADYVLLTLEDYYLIHKVNTFSIKYLVDKMRTEKIDYLSLYDRRRDKEKLFCDISNIATLDLNQKYAVTLYPAIWSKEFLINSVRKDMSPWSYEPLLTCIAKESGANCKRSNAGAFRILDVIRKGKILRGAYRYLIMNGIHTGTRPRISYWTELKLAAADRISWYLPRSLFRIVKKFAKYYGFEFYSED